MSRDTEFISSFVKLGVLTVVSILVTGLLAAIMGNFGFGEGREYQAIFSTASSLKSGDDVRVAGVSVGEVKDVEHYERTQAIVTFRVKSDVEMTTASRAEIRFLNLVGDRYLGLEEGDTVGAAPLEEDDVIPITNTAPALDLTTLFNGFKPLFAGLQPEQVNELSLNLIQVLQGEGGTVKSLLDRTASLTTTLANRDQLIGEVIDNLNTTMVTVDSRSEELTLLIQELEGWTRDLAADRQTIGASLDSISDLTVVVSDLLNDGRPLLKRDIRELRRLSASLTTKQSEKLVIELLDRLPESMTDQTRTGTYGSWYNYYICGFSGEIRLPEIEGIPNALLEQLTNQLSNINFRSTAPRCANTGGAG